MYIQEHIWKESMQIVVVGLIEQIKHCLDDGLDKRLLISQKFIRKDCDSASDSSWNWAEAPWPSFPHGYPKSHGCLQKLRVSNQKCKRHTFALQDDNCNVWSPSWFWIIGFHAYITWRLNVNVLYMVLYLEVIYKLYTRSKSVAYYALLCLHLKTYQELCQLFWFLRFKLSL